MIGIYKITSPTNKVYIGQSIEIENRFKNYKKLSCKQQKIIYKSFLKYGVEKHKFEIICECELNELNDKERYYQDIFSAMGVNGMNCKLTKSSDKNGKHSEETKLKIGLGNKGKIISEEHKIKISNFKKGTKLSESTKNKISKSIKGKNLGKIFSENHKHKISESNKGKIISEETKNKMSESQKKLILNTQTGIFYLGAKEASESINIKINTLRKKLNGILINETSLIYI